MLLLLQLLQPPLLMLLLPLFRRCMRISKAGIIALEPCPVHRGVNPLSLYQMLLNFQVYVNVDVSCRRKKLPTTCGFLLYPKINLICSLNQKESNLWGSKQVSPPDQLPTYLHAYVNNRHNVATFSNSNVLNIIRNFLANGNNVPVHLHTLS